MNMEEYFRALETYVASRKLNLGDGGAVLSLLYEAYGDVNRIYDDQIKADFAELYHALNGMPLQEMDWIINPVCSLRRDHERNGFVYDRLWQERLRNRSLPQKTSALSMNRGFKLGGPRGNRYHSGKTLNKSSEAEQRLCRITYE